MLTKEKYLKGINYNFAEKQKVTGEQLSKLGDLYVEKDKIFQQLSAAKTPEDILNKTFEWTKIEYEIQDNWNFERNYDFHRFWTNPHCTCPYLDNKDRWGMKEKITSLSCPIHSNKEFMCKIKSLENKEIDTTAIIEDFLKDIV